MVVLDPIPGDGVTTLPPIQVGVPDTSVSSAPPVPSDTAVTVPPTSGNRAVTSSTGPTTTKPASTPTELSERIGREIGLAGGTPGVLVLIDGQKVADIGSAQPKLPASTQKLYVASAALALLGPDYRFSTTVRADSPTGGAVGTLTLVGGGDPTLTSGHLAALAASVKASGISVITARLMVDDSRYDRVTTAPGWKPSFAPGESGILSALMIDGNQRNDAAFLADPALSNLTKFQAALTKVGVVSTGAALVRSSAPVGSVVASRQSEPLSSIVSVMGKKSNNTIAEMLLKEIGVVSGNGGSTSGGAVAINAHLGQLGVVAPARIADGSGLSSLNRTSAASEVSLLIKVDGSKQRTAFRSSLAVACVDGTMKSRLCGTAGSGTVVAKTGTIDNVAALTGYAVTASGRKVVFSFLLNGLRSSASGRLAIDRALVQIIGYTG